MVDRSRGSRRTRMVGRDPMTREERQRRIRERVLADGSVRVGDLADEYAVSGMTIRRDLDTLEEQGWLRKVRGGARAELSALYHGDVRHRMQTNNEAKQAVAEHALELVSRGQTVMIDESTTGYFLARLLPARRPLTVITNFLPSLQLLSREPGVDLIAVGGPYWPAYDAFLGVGTADALSALSADILFASTTAISDRKCFHRSQETVVVKRALMRAAARRILLVDHAKFGQRAAHLLGPLTDFDLVVVDAGTDARQVADLRAGGVQVAVAGEPDELPAQASNQ
jgi:DeoR/GlpR family transcriptional regulator of sugar metabolism